MTGDDLFIIFYGILLASLIVLVAEYIDRYRDSDKKGNHRR